MYKETIGLIGGFGAYATLNFYRRILEEFATESERNYPHIMMDNNFTMPSRTRALLYDEEYDVVVRKIADSMKKLIYAKADRIILVCGTAHYFLKDVYKIVPEAETKVMNIIDCLGKKLKENNIQEVLIIAAEGALLKQLYPNKLKEYGISCISPSEEDYAEIRYFIEGVKNDKISSGEYLERFKQFLDKFYIRNVVLGCTEFPVLINYERQSEGKTGIDNDYIFWDPMEMIIEELKKQLV